MSNHALPSLVFVGAFPNNSNKNIHGGAITACRTLLEAGLEKHFALTLFDITQKSIPSPPLWKKIPRNITRLVRYFILIAKHKPQLVLLLTTVKAAFLEKTIMSIIAKAFGSKVLMFPRAGVLMDACKKSKTLKRYVKTSLSFSDVLLCQEQIWKDFFINDLMIAPQKCTIIKNWTATPELLGLGHSKQYNNSIKVKILYLGWISESKGIMDLLSVFMQVSNLFPSSTLNIAGDGVMMKQCKQFVKEKKLDSQVFFHGWVKGDKKRELLRTSDVFCLPSHREGLPNAMIEAMAAGIPVVVTNVGTIPDVISNNINGLLCDKQNISELKNAITSLITDKDKRKRIGRAGHETAKINFSADNAIIELKKTATKLLD